MREIDRVSYDANAVLPDPPPATGSMADQTAARIEQAVDTYYPAYREHGYKPQIVGGLMYTQEVQRQRHVHTRLRVLLQRFG